MKENQLPVTFAEETGRVRSAVDSGYGGVHLPREPVTHVEARPAGNFRADDISNSVQITLAHFSAASSASATSAVAASRALPGLSNQYVAYDPARDTTLERARDSRRGTLLLAAAVMSVTTLYSILYTICHPEWVRSFVAQSEKISKQLSADIKGRSSTPLDGTAAADAANAAAGTVAGAGPVAGVAGILGAPSGLNSASAVQPKSDTATYGETRSSEVRGGRPVASASLRDVDPSAAQHYDSSRGAHQTFVSDRDETGTHENSRRHTQNGNHTARSNAGSSGSGFLVPPPPPTPCVLPSALGFFPLQPAQQHAALRQQQQLEQAQAQASLTTHNQTAVSLKTEATKSAALVDADQELQAALSSSLRTVGEWTR